MDIMARVLSKSKSLDAQNKIGTYYRPLRTIGKGGFGTVWLAEDVRTKQVVAIKMLPHQSAPSPDALAAIKRECDVLKDLSHPNICRVLDLMYDSNYGILLVTEYIDGEDLYTATAQLPPSEVTCLMAQVFQALAYLHGHRVQHLDIKPGNILVTKGGVKLIDFGLAGVSPLYRGGTPSHLAPEMGKGVLATDRVDLYAMGVMWYECLTREQPFHGETRELLREQHRTHFPKPPSKFGEIQNKKIPEWIDAVIEGLLKKDPNDRYISARDVLGQIYLVDPVTMWKTSGATSGISTGNVFVGRCDAMAAFKTGLRAIRSDNPKLQVIAVSSYEGMGKSSLLRQMKFESQLQDVPAHWMGLDVQDILAAVEGLSSVLSMPNQPAVIIIDSLDKLMRSDRYEFFRNFIKALMDRPKDGVRLLFVYSCNKSRKKPFPDVEKIELELPRLNLDDIREYVAKWTMQSHPAKLNEWAELIFKKTQGQPRLLVRMCNTVIGRGFLGNTAGRWEESLLDDVSIEWPDLEHENKPLSHHEFVEGCREKLNSHHVYETYESCINQIHKLVKDEKATSPEVTELLELLSDAALRLGKANSVVEGLADLLMHNVTRMRLFATLLIACQEFQKAETILDAIPPLTDDIVERLMAQNCRARLEMVRDGGDRDKALRLYHESREQQTTLPEPQKKRITNNELGQLLWMSGRPDEALSVLLEDFKFYKMVSAKPRIARTAYLLGEVNRALNHFVEAEPCYEEAIVLSKGLQDRDLLGVAYVGKANLLYEQGQMESAAETYRRALALYYCTTNRGQIALAAVNLANCLIQEKKYAEADPHMSTALTYLDESGAGVKTLMSAWLGWADICWWKKQYDAALEFVQKAEDFGRGNDMLEPYLYPIAFMRTKIARDRGETAAARDLFQETKCHAHGKIEIEELMELEHSLE